MSETKHYFLHCDAGAGPTRCFSNEMGDVGEPPSRMRRRLASKGWTSHRPEPTEEQRRYGVKPQIKADYCPAHAHLATEK